MVGRCAIATMVLALGSCSDAGTFDPCANLAPSGCDGELLSADDGERCVSGWNATAKCRAKHLGVDYRDLVFTVLTGYLKKGWRAPTADLELQFVVSVFGEDVDVELADRLKAAGVAVARREDKAVPSVGASQGFYTVQIEIPSVKRVAAGRYQVVVNYYCGDLCASGVTFELRGIESGYEIVSFTNHNWAA